MSERRTARLPPFLRPGRIDTLVRLGRDHDGGYLVDARSVDAADFLLSFGISDDWSFEADFRARNPVPVTAFDGSVGTKQYFKHLVMSTVRIDKPGTFLHWARVMRRYRTFFRGEVRHVRRHVGIEGDPAYAAMAEVVDGFVPPGARDLFLKVDVEGWEYRVLDDLLALSERTCGLAIEFHDVDLHLDRIAAFVEALPLRLCHVHCNNHSPIGAGSRPLVVEAAFTRFPPLEDGPARLPHPADMPNDARFDDYDIVFDG